MSAITDLLTKASSGTRPSPTTLTAPKSIGATSITGAALTGWNATTAVHFIIYNVDANNNKIAGSQTDYKGLVSGSTITNMVLKAGTDNGYAIGAVVEAAPTASWADDLYTWGIAQHAEDGTHTAITATSMTASGDTADNSTTHRVVRDETMADHVTSGGVWTGDSLGVTRAASMTALVCYIEGYRLAVSAITSRSFTASKDTYIDITHTTTTPTVVYTEVSNNAASPALAAHSIRIGIIVTAAGSIAAAGSINQGQETMILPIASSIPYAVTDSLGNLICLRDPQSRLLGYRQIVANQSAFTGAATQIVGLSVPVIIPTGRKIKVTLVLPQHLPATAFGTGFFSIWEGTVGSGTQRQLLKQVYLNNDTTIFANTVDAEFTPTSTSLTFNAGAGNSATGGSTTTVNAAATAPTFLKVELA